MSPSIDSHPTPEALKALHPKGIAGGLLLALAGILLLWWNEGRLVQLHLSLKEGAAVAVSIPADEPDPENDGRLVHVSGLAQNSEMLFDPDFGVGAQGIRLMRKTEMFQWVESKEERTVTQEDSTTVQETQVSYRGQWLPEVRPSQDFVEAQTRVNPGALRWRSRDWTAQNVQMGAFRIPPELAAKVQGAGEYAIPSQLKLPDLLQGKARNLGSHIYVGNNPENPEVGDMRVRYELVLNQPVTLLARQTGNSFTPFPTSNGKELFHIQDGTHAASVILSTAGAEQAPGLSGWLRLLGIVFILFGIAGAFQPIIAWGGIIPVVGRIGSFGHGLLTLPLAILLSCGSIGGAWLTTRPVFGASVILPGVLVAGWLLWRGGRRKEWRG